MWSITVNGTPASKGNLKCVGRGGLHRLIENDKSGNLAPWRAQLAEAGRRLTRAAGGTLDGAVELDVTFRVPRPKSVRRPHPSVKPDLDKYLRALLDAFTDGGIWHDDGQVTEITARKQYATPDHPAGATITITPLGEQS